MPFVSNSQRRKFHQLMAEGKMDQKTIDEWEKDTPKVLPERLPKAKKAKKMVKKARAAGQAKAFKDFGFGEV